MSDFYEAFRVRGEGRSQHTGETGFAAVTRPVWERYVELKRNPQPRRLDSSNENMECFQYFEVPDEEAVPSGVKPFALAVYFTSLRGMEVHVPPQYFLSYKVLREREDELTAALKS